MSNWVLWNELLNQGIKNLDIFECLKRGLQPYSKLGNPIYCHYDYHRYKYLSKKHSRLNNLIKSLAGSDPPEKIFSEGTELSVIRLDDYLKESIEKYNREVSADDRVQIHDYVFIDLREQFENLIKFKKCLEKQNEETIKEIEDIIDDDPNLNEDQKKLSWKYFIKPDSEEKYNKIVSKLENALFKKDDVNRFVKKKDVDIANHKEKTTEQDIETFIRDLRVSYENDNEVKIQIPNRKAKSFTCEGLGFRDKTTKEWKTFIKILQDAPHTYYIGPASKTVNGVKTKIKPYDAQRQLLVKINKKLVVFLNKQYSAKITSDFILYEQFKGETPGTYKFKFQVISDEPAIKSISEKKYENLSKENLLTHLHDMGTEYSSKPDSDYLKTKIDTCVQVLKTTHGMTEEEIMDFINPSTEKEEIIYNPYENLEDSEPDY